jgi:7-keto-8-aminopelargonate synthetase-like enzyme
LNADRSAIIPLIVGGEAEAVAAATALRDAGIYIPAVRYPTVARGQARLRLTVTAAHTSEELRTLLRGLSPLIGNRKS